VKMLIKSLTQVRQVSAGSSHTVLLTANGHVLTCGSNHVSNSTHTARWHTLWSIDFQEIVKLLTPDVRF